MWSHKRWFGSLFPAATQASHALAEYARIFNSIEGNTGLYQIPHPQTVKSWAQSVPEPFRFTFKFHQEISHTRQLQDVDQLVQTQLTSLNSLGEKLGCMMLQLPAAFPPEKLHLLDTFLASMPSNIRVAVEVRHLGFFDKQKNERKLNQILIKHNAARIIMDTRALFSVQQPSEKLVIDVQAKKPKVPTHVVSTSDFVVVRYVGHPQLAENRTFYAPWLNKLVEWIKQNKSVYFFMHMPDNALAPWLIEQFVRDFNIHFPANALHPIELPKPPSEQTSLF